VGTTTDASLRGGHYLKLVLLVLLPLLAAGEEIRVPASAGSGDSTNVIQRALNSCGRGDTVSLPAATFTAGLLKLPVGCSLNGVRGRTTLRARGPAPAMLYAAAENRNSSISNIVFDMNNAADAGVKFDWQLTGGVIRYNVFKNGGRMGAVFIPGGSTASDRRSSIDHNIFLNVRHGINSYNKPSDLDIAWNYMDTFDQGISAGGCKHDLPAGTDVAVEHNTFVRGRRMAIEFCGRFINLSASWNYITNWQPSPNPDGENYRACSGSRPFMCDSMGISLSVGQGHTLKAEGNRIYRQPGTSWGIVIVAQPPARFSLFIVNNGGRAYVDESCAKIGGRDNCAATRQGITENIACGGNVAEIKGDFSRWPASNRYFPSCASAGFPADDPLPAMPFDPETGAGPAGSANPSIPRKKRPGTVR
jgi:hypothetical protein